MFFCTALRGVDGARLSDLPPTPARYRAFGQAIGALHAASMTFTPDPAWPHMPDPALPGTFPTWRLFWDRAGASAHLEATIGQAYDDLTPWVHAVGGLPSGWPGGATAPGVGLAHGDLRPGNALWDGHRVVIIDFDEQVHGPLANDLARAVLELTPEQYRHQEPALLGGYREHLPLDLQWEAALPDLIRARAVLMAAWQLEGERDPAALRPVSGSAAPVSAWQLREHLRSGVYGP
ncbi:phosphotransferase [uncultured Deinococcus sp.]|uniref:phosphotransferase enzyme family protein n=1 Tax=uncultured Deinococcus sp. TaxID=158789 RepID=UPI0025DC33AF|nr:phosphotransferase [uncultured Deinococcus sp.]